MNDSSRQESGDRRGIPVWAWFAVINLIVVVAAVIGVAAYLKQDRPVVVVPPVEQPPPPAPQPKPSQHPANKKSTENENEDAPTKNKPDEKKPEAPETKPKPVKAASTPTAARTTADVVAKVQDGVVLLTTYGSGGEKLGYGSGFVIDSKGLVATNFHVLRSASSAEAEFHNRDKIKIKAVRAWDMATDLGSRTEIVPSRPNGASVAFRRFTFSTTTASFVTRPSATSPMPSYRNGSRN